MVAAALSVSTVLGLVLAVVDLRRRRLPFALSGTLAAMTTALLGIAVLTDGHWAALGRAVLVAAGVSVVLTIVALAFPGQLGLGDVAFAGALELTLGWFGLDTALGGLAAGLLLALPSALWNTRRRPAEHQVLVPLGPALLGGWLLAVASALS